MNEWLLCAIIVLFFQIYAIIKMEGLKEYLELFNPFYVMKYGKILIILSVFLWLFLIWSIFCLYMGLN